MGSSDDVGRQLSSFEVWKDLQQEDLSELLQIQTLNPDDPENQLAQTRLAENCLRHFQDYIDRRSRLARNDVSAFFAPTWCTSLENSLLWIAGCRPSIYIRLVYALCGSEFESKLPEFLQGLRTGNLGELSAKQLKLVNDLQSRTIREEEKMASWMASLQEEIVDHPLAEMAKAASPSCESTQETDKALDDHARSMVSILEEADRLRINTVKELIDILTPIQAVEFLAVSKKLHFCVHEWGRKRDQMHGRN
ncbi:2-deoxyglucose-6-phosphatase [Sarracenia purpurea var. burkii]